MTKITTRLLSGRVLIARIQTKSAQCYQGFGDECITMRQGIVSAVFLIFAVNSIMMPSALTLTPQQGVAVNRNISPMLGF
jgi:hypothetical protein